VKSVIPVFAWFVLLCQDPGETSSTSWAVREESQNGPQPVLSDESKTISDKTMDELVRSMAFRKAARKAWRATWNGTAQYETGFSIDENGRPGEMQSSEFASQGGLSHLRPISKSNALGTFHILRAVGLRDAAFSDRLILAQADFRE